MDVEARPVDIALFRAHTIVTDADRGAQAGSSLGGRSGNCGEASSVRKLQGARMTSGSLVAIGDTYMTPIVLSLCPDPPPPVLCRQADFLIPARHR